MGSSRTSLLKPFDYNQVWRFVLVAHNAAVDTCAADAESVLIRGCLGISG